MLLPYGANPKLEPPDPYLAGAVFLVWLIKLDEVVELSVCEYQWNLNKKKYPNPGLDDVDLKNYLESLGCELIVELIVENQKCIRMTQKGSEWAIRWARHYGVSGPIFIKSFEDILRLGIRKKH